MEEEEESTVIPRCNVPSHLIQEIREDERADKWLKEPRLFHRIWMMEFLKKKAKNQKSFSKIPIDGFLSISVHRWLNPCQLRPQYLNRSRTARSPENLSLEFDMLPFGYISLICIFQPLQTKNICPYIIKRSLAHLKWSFFF